MARNAGAWSIGVPGGFPNAAALERAKPDLFAARLADAVDALIGAARKRRMISAMRSAARPSP